MVLPPLDESRNTLPRLEHDENDVVRVLCVDGGGIKGLLPLQAIKDLEEKTGKPVSELFDLMVGTSTGGIIVSSLAVPGPDGKPKWSADELIQKYIKMVKSAFTNSLIHKVITCNGIFGAKIESRGFDQLLHNHYGEIQMSELLTGVSIPCFSITKNRPGLFNSRHLPGGMNHNFRVADVIGGITAAPIYFRPMRISDVTNKNEDIIIDAGIYAKDPVLFASNIATQIFPGRRMIIVSLGTGTNPGFVDSLQRPRWGLSKWGPILYELATRGQSITVDWMLRIQAGAPLPPVIGYYRIDETLAPNTDHWYYTGPGQAAELNQTGRKMVEKNQDKIKEIADVLGNPTIKNVMNKGDIGITPWTETLDNEKNPAKSQE